VPKILLTSAATRPARDSNTLSSFPEARKRDNNDSVGKEMPIRLTRPTQTATASSRLTLGTNACSGTASGAGKMFCVSQKD